MDLNPQLPSRRRRGAVLPLIAVMLPVLLILSAFAINIVYIQLCQTELQISTDIAAKAAGRNYAINQDSTQALALANQAGQLNKVANDPLVFESSDLRLGVATIGTSGGRYTFAQNAIPTDPVNSLELIGRRDSASSQGEIGIYLPTLLGSSSFAIETTSVSTQLEVDIAIVLDRSGSMAYADNEVADPYAFPAAAPVGWNFGSASPNPSRWRDAVNSVNAFLTEINNSPLDEQIALASYADGARIDTNLTKTFSNIQTELSNQTATFNGGGTNISAGLQAGAAALSVPAARSFATKVIIILTDGRRTVGPDASAMANSIADDGTMIICITFAQEADQTTMKNIANIGNGFHIHAVDSTALTEAFRTISRKLPTILTR